MAGRAAHHARKRMLGSCHGLRRRWCGPARLSYEILPLDDQRRSELLPLLLPVVKCVEADVVDVLSPVNVPLQCCSLRNTFQSGA